MRPEHTSGANESVWTDGRRVGPLAPLTRDATADVCVIGAGIAGLTTAYLLARDGRKVILIEDGAVGSGETGRTTAHLTVALDDRYEAIEKLQGEQGAKLAAESHSAAISRIEAILEEERIDCGFERVDGYLFLSPEDERKELDKEAIAASRAGLDVKIVKRAPIESFDTGPALRFRQQGQYHPLRYLDGLAEAFRRRGGTLHTGTHASSLERETPLRVVTKGGPVVRAGTVVVATNSPVFNRVAIHTKQSAYRTYVVAFPVDRDVVPALLLWDTGSGKHRPYPYHYVRIARANDFGRSDNDVLIVGGEDHKTGQAEDSESRWARLEEWTRERFPVRGDPSHRWSGQIMEPVDAMGFCGKDPGGSDHVYVATGDSGNGMTNGTVAGILITDLIAERKNPWTELYEPSRKSLRSLGTWARENANVAAQYGDWLQSGDVASADEVARGGGAVIVQGLSRLAVHRDKAGKLWVRSAVCPHLGCVVQWNDGEKSWDCPCHGSRFDARGKVLNGPARTDLESATLDEGGV
jgi:glycine/D-amino acid oxidase-like deaminating enzyme/nitrite reductase/ring-hydroxylating ferredoxin subunit